jgi:hypothetical protein
MSAIIIITAITTETQRPITPTTMGIAVTTKETARGIAAAAHLRAPAEGPPLRLAAGPPLHRAVPRLPAARSRLAVAPRAAPRAVPVSSNRVRAVTNRSYRPPALSSRGLFFFSQRMHASATPSTSASAVSRHTQRRFCAPICRCSVAILAYGLQRGPARRESFLPTYNATLSPPLVLI